jgi:hypothetical protein
MSQGLPRNALVLLTARRCLSVSGVRTISAISYYASWYTADRKDRSTVAWIALTVILGWLALFTPLLLREEKPASLSPLAR